MSIMLADIDATCASLGYYDGKIYIPEPDALQALKVSVVFDYFAPNFSHWNWRINLNCSIWHGYCAVMVIHMNIGDIWATARCCRPIYCQCSLNKRKRMKFPTYYFDCWSILQRRRCFSTEKHCQRMDQIAEISWIWWKFYIHLKRPSQIKPFGYRFVDDCKKSWKL